MSRFQVAISDKSGRGWDTIKPTVRECIRRIGYYLSLEDEGNLIFMGDMIEACDDDYLRAIEILINSGFDITIKEIKV